MVRADKILVLLLLLAGFVSAQGPYQYQLEKTMDKCVKGTVKLTVSGQQTADSVTTLWSTGATNTLQLNHLSGGFYSVQIKIVHRQDTSINTVDTTLVFVKDTTIQFSIVQDECPVFVERYFSPNDDGYNDVLAIGNVEKYPNFEFIVYNKWGQRVYHQQAVYKPWDGKWLGVALPDGAYYYVFFFDADDRTRLIKGDVTILR